MRCFSKIERECEVKKCCFAQKYWCKNADKVPSNLEGFQTLKNTGRSQTVVADRSDRSAFRQVLKGAPELGDR